MKRMGKENLKKMTQLDILTTCYWMIWNIIIIGYLPKLIHKLKHGYALLASQVPSFIPSIFNLLLSKILRHKMIAKKLVAFSKWNPNNLVLLFWFYFSLSLLLSDFTADSVKRNGLESNFHYLQVHDLIASWQ